MSPSQTVPVSVRVRPPAGLLAAPGHLPTLQVLLVAASDVAEARAGLAVALAEEQQAAQALETARINCELEAIVHAGGEKALGPNEAAQKRTLASVVEQCVEYRTARAAHQEAQLDRRLAETDVTFAEGQFQALLAALQQHILQVPVSWIELPGQARAGWPVDSPPADIPSNGNLNSPD